MPTYYMNEGAFELLEAGFVDRTVHVFGGAVAGREDLSLLVRRERIAPGKSLRDMAIAQLDHDKEQLRNHAVLEDRETEIAGVPAVVVRARFRHEDRLFFQQQAHLAVLDTWLLFAMTAPMPLRALCEEQLGDLLASLRLRDVD